MIEAPSCAVTSEPSTATPSAEPTCRLVDATPAATPACVTGIPDTAVFVIGALTMPKPTPNTTYAATTRSSGVSTSRLSSRAPLAAIPAPPTRSGSRVPRVATIRPEIGGSSTVIAAMGRVSSPACSGENPRTSCR